ncbi:hypothetical protein [Paracoccus rhizosphaerae]|uniref:Uncharacterized protein n=1 Tax=Paracoccus rhizosphaerae TaxID=1133347 RepID=A0ABV6CIK4_9RHOB|nr:hypothetical protein [Paracoccus rhizosphaerae]
MNKALLKTIRNRMPWAIASRAFRANGIPTSQGWDRTIGRLKSLKDDKLETIIESLLFEHALFGEKFTKFYSVTDKQKNKIREFIEGVDIPNNVFSAAFPKEVNKAAFENVTEPQVPVAKFSNGDGMCLVYTSEMKLTYREKLSAGDFGEAVSDILRGYDEIIGLKFRSVQLFNVIWISHFDNLLEVRVDNPQGMPSEASHQLHSLLKGMINNALGKNKLEFARDLFPLIDSIYNSEDGKVVELGFSTSTGSVKLEKMRRTKTCLREELYHVGGKRELKTRISPYKISVQWSFGGDDEAYRPELTLAGTSRGLNSIAAKQSAPQVTGASIANCIGAVDYEHVRERISAHLTKVSPASSEISQTAAE